MNKITKAISGSTLSAVGKNQYCSRFGSRLQNLFNTRNDSHSMSTVFQMHTRQYSFQFAFYSLTIHKEFVVFVYYHLANNIFFSAHAYYFVYMLAIYYMASVTPQCVLICSNYRWWKSAIRHPQDAVFLLPFNNFFSSKYRNHEIIMISPGWTLFRKCDLLLAHFIHSAFLSLFGTNSVWTISWN